MNILNSEHNMISSLGVETLTLPKLAAMTNLEEMEQEVRKNIPTSFLYIENS